MLHNFLFLHLLSLRKVGVSHFIIIMIQYLIVIQMIILFPSKFVEIYDYNIVYLTSWKWTKPLKGSHSVYLYKTF